MKKTCGTCDHFGSETDQCLAIPPVVSHSEYQGEPTTRYPAVVATDLACGDHKPIVTEPETTNDDRVLALDKFGRGVAFWRNAGDAHMSLEEVIEAWLAAGFGVSHTYRR